MRLCATRAAPDSFASDRGSSCARTQPAHAVTPSPPCPWPLSSSRWRSRTCAAAPLAGEMAPSVDHIVVSEVMTGGASASDEFVELYNPGPDARALDGLELVYVTASGATVTRKATWGPGAEIGPGGHVLVANESGVFAGIADVTYANGLSAAGGSMALRVVGAATAIDAVGWGTASSTWLETAPAPAPPAGSSVERLPGGSLGSGQDTDHNLVDFVVRVAPDPQNSTSPPVPAESAAPSPTDSPDSTPSPTASPTLRRRRCPPRPRANANPDANSIADRHAFADPDAVADTHTVADRNPDRNACAAHRGCRASPSRWHPGPRGRDQPYRRRVPRWRGIPGRWNRRHRRPGGRRHVPEGREPRRGGHRGRSVCPAHIARDVHRPGHREPRCRTASRRPPIRRHR